MMPDEKGALWLTFKEAAVVLRRTPNLIHQRGSRAQDEEQAARLVGEGKLPFQVIGGTKMVRVRHVRRLQIFTDRELVTEFGVETGILIDSRDLRPRAGRFYSLDDVDVLAGRPRGSLEDTADVPQADTQPTVSALEPRADAETQDARSRLEAALRHIAIMPDGPLRRWHLNEALRRAASQGVGFSDVPMPFAIS